MLVGDINYKKLDWENFRSVGGDTARGDGLLNLTVGNVMTQWVKENARHGSEGRQARLDLLALTRGVCLESDLKCECPTGRIGHVILRVQN